MSEVQDQPSVEAALVGYLEKRNVPVPENVEVLLEDMTARMMAVIVPRSPQSNHECAAFELACYAQIAYELGLGGGAEAAVEVATPKYKSVRIGDFSATFADEQGSVSGESELFPNGLCANARASLRCAGLMYRGVSR